MLVRSPLRRGFGARRATNAEASQVQVRPTQILGRDATYFAEQSFVVLHGGSGAHAIDGVLEKAPHLRLFFPPVEDPPPLFSLGDEACAAQLGEVGRDGRGGQVDDGRHLTHAQLAIAEHAQQPQPHRVREGLVA